MKSTATSFPYAVTTSLRRFVSLNGATQVICFHSFAICSFHTQSEWWARVLLLVLIGMPLYVRMRHSL